MAGYKAIIKNMVEMEVIRFVESKSGEFVDVQSVKLSTDKGFDNPTFEVEVVVGLTSIIKKDFLISGYVTEYGNVQISSISYDRIVKKACESKFKKVSEFVSWYELADFNFDK